MPALEKTANTYWNNGDTIVAFALVILVPMYYTCLLTGFTFHIFAPQTNGLTFNSMLLHLLRGRVDVDPAAITYEGYVHNGKVYPYFGIVPALFRVIFLWLPNFAAIDFSVTACLTAACTMALFKLLSARLIWRAVARPQDTALLALMTLACVASGPQIQFLRPSIYQEVELWAGALAAAFVYLVLCGLIREAGFTPRVLMWLAIVSGLCLLTRVSNAIGLYMAFGLLWLVLCWRELRARSSCPSRARLAARLPPVVVLIGFAAAAGTINYSRWGNPLIFVDFHGALIGRIAWRPELQQHGDFNLSRLGFGLFYYFLPVSAWRGAAGQLLPLRQQSFGQCCVELPPSSFFISDPLLVGLAAFGFLSFLRRPAPQRALVLAVGAGFLAPILLIMTYFYMTFRYRMEFYPLLDLFAFLGFARLLASPERRALVFAGVVAFAGILSAHAMWLLYCLSPFGPAGRVLGPLGVGAYYRSLFLGHARI